MALQMTFIQSSGVAATYHRIVSATADFERNTTTLQMQSYLNEAARQNGLTPICGCSITVDGMPSFTGGDPRPWAYAQFKARGEWEGAIDG